jgi:hypothetical protein
LGVRVGESAVDEWKWLFMNECECKSPISTMMEFLNMFEDGRNVPLFLVIIMIKNDTSLE